MKGLGAIREELEWPNARQYLHWRIRRRLREGAAAKAMAEQVPNLEEEDAMVAIQDLIQSKVVIPAAQESNPCATTCQQVVMAPRKNNFLFKNNPRRCVMMFVLWGCWS